MPLKLCERLVVNSAELPFMHKHKHEGIGAAVPRVGAKRLVQGQARYCDDIELPRMVHVCFLRSPYAHARILSVDTKAARAMPGVVSVLTGADLREHCEPFLGVLNHLPGMVSAPQWPLALNTARWQGEPVVMIAAQNRALAEDALALVEVDWAPLEPVVDPEAEARIEAGDRQRLTRAWAVARHTGRALSAWTADTRPLLPPGSWTGQVIEPDREALYARCDLRVAQMVEAGALEEVRALMARGLDPALPAMKAVGVREFAAHLAGACTLAAAVEATRQATRNYAKRQLTWFRNQTPGWARV
jgi:hypothetical protein